MRTRLPRSGRAVALAACLLISCGSEATNEGTAEFTHWSLVPLGQPLIPADNAQNPAKIELGSLLFHDPLLSRDSEVACVTCHSQYWGLSDGLELSVGLDGVGPAGLGRTGPNITRRNSPTHWNVGFRESLFWDGRSPSLEDQALAPLLDPGEMGKDPATVVAELAEIPEYVELFEAAFPEMPEPLTVATMAMAIASFERTLLSNDAPYDQYAAGDYNAMSASEVRGMNLVGELGCHSCHSPPRFEADLFASSGIPDLSDATDLGRAEVSSDPDDEGHFRVPSLRNLRETGPYFHNGSVEQLDEAVSHEVSQHGVRSVNDVELEDLVAFLSKSLMDRSADPARPETVPSGLPVPLDGFRIVR